MEYKALVVGNDSFCSSLVRSLVNIDPLTRSLTRFLYSRNGRRKLLTCDVDQLDKILFENRDIRLIIACMDLTDLGLIRDIRVGKFGESIARVPLIVISLHLFTEASVPLVLYHIWESGAFFQLPFKLQELWKTLESVRVLSDEQLLRIRSNRTVFCQVIDSVDHSLDVDNCRTCIEYILSIADSNFPEEFVTIKSLRNVLNESEKANGNSLVLIKHALNTLRREVSNGK